MSVAQEYEDWQKLVTKIKETQTQLTLEANILRDIEVMLDRDMLSLSDMLRIRYCLNGTTRKIEIKIDRNYGMESEDPMRERIMLVKRYLVADLAEFLFLGVLGKIDPTKI
jgi:hypothetical protein